jgi:biotin carboxyl carrier protein
MKELLVAPTTGVLMTKNFNEGDLVRPGDVVATIESMKMMFDITSSSTGYIHYYLSEQSFIASEDLIAGIKIIE